jgi:microcin C transport system substrate-binding protein
VPQWHKGSHTLAYWDIFGRPATKPKYARGVLETWWIDPAKAATLRRGP